MRIREHASQFSVLVFSTDLEKGPEIKLTISQAGYETYFIDSEGSVFERLEQFLPHVLVFTVSSLRSPLTEFISRLNQLSEEMKIIMVVADENFMISTNYIQYGVTEILPEKINQLSERCLWAMDRCCENLYLSYQNEELFNQLKSKATDEKPVINEVSFEMPIAPKVVQTNLSVPEVLSSFHNATQIDELLQIMVQFISSSRVIYLKYFEAIQSFVAFQSNFKSPEEIQNIGCQLQPAEAQDLSKQMTLGIVPVSLKEMAEKAFEFQNPEFWPLVVEAGKTEGVLISDQLSAESRVDFINRWSLFGLIYKNFSIEKKMSQLEIFDSITEAYNEKFYFKKISEEFLRAKRTQQPLAILKLSLDDEAEIIRTLGEATRNNILKKLVQLAQKTSRSHDFVCRTQDNELSVILPYCEKKGAEIRGERLRRLFESQSLTENGLKMTISVGASEYPSLCSSYEKLDETSKKAMQFIQSKGGNRLCFYKAPATHQPDFIVGTSAIAERRTT